MTLGRTNRELSEFLGSLGEPCMTEPLPIASRCVAAIGVKSAFSKRQRGVRI